MDDKEKNDLVDELRKALESGDIENAPIKKLDQWLLALSTGRIANEGVRQNFIILGLAVSHFRTEQIIRRLEETIKKLNASNDRSQKVITYLAIIATLAAVVQVALAIYLLK